MRGKLIVAVCLILLCAAQPGVADLVGYWPLNEGGGTQVIDQTGNGHTGTIEGATWTSPGWNGKGTCLEFDGVNDLVRVPDAEDLRFGAADAYALTAWVNFTTRPGHWSGVVTKGRETGNWYGIWVDGSNAWVFGHQPANQIGSTIVAGEWTHVAMVYDNGSKKIYLNGQLDNEATTSAAADNTADLVFGAALGVTEFAPVRLNEIRIYNHALDDAEVVASMESLSPAELASNPIPDDEATDVPYDVILAWTAGEYAATHDVYFGASFDDVNDASRANPMDVLLSQGQSAAAYDPPGLLEFAQTYYWRIDEVNAAPDNTIFKGAVWSFTAEPFAYAVPNVVATSNGVSEADASPENTVNGSGLNADDQHSTDAPDMWLASPGAEPLWIQYEFDRVYKLSEMLVWNYNVQFELILGFGLKNVTVEYSQDGAEWMVLGDFDLAKATAKATYVANTVVPFAGVAARYVRLTVNSGYGMMGQFGLSEVRFLFVPAHAREPQPADGTIDVNPDVVLAWRAGREAVSHEVYLGSDPQSLALVDSTSSPAHAPQALALGGTYYWRVDEVNEADAVTRWTGDIWSFVVCPYVVVDDMEDYTDDADAGRAIFQAWIDGWENGTGSLVGYIDVPFAEQTLVHGGRQSMPLGYDNTVSPNYSEAVRTFDSPQDWTAYGVQSLALYFRGRAGNTGQLYLRIGNAKVVYDGDATDIGRAIWQVWNIDLSTVGGNLRSVVELAIGVDGAGATGLVLIDDIRLYPQAAERITPVEPDTASLVARYALDGNVNDGSGNGYNGTIIGAPSYVTGVEGQALLLGGDEDYVDFGTPAGWPSGREPRSMTGWGKTSSIAIGWRWIAAYGTGATSQAMFIGLYGPDLYGGGHGDDVMSPGFWDTDEWHHVGLTYDGATARLYADGVEVASAAKNWNLVPSRAHIGRQVSDQIEFWTGSVDDVRIYSEALSAGEITWLAGRRSPVHKPF